jgi:adenylate cyclase
MAEKRSGSKQLSPIMVYGLICLGVVLVVLMLHRLEMFDHAENSTYDLRFRIRGVETHNDDIVIVAIDPQTLDMLGLIGMPPRDYHVKLIENLYLAGAKAVLFDVLFLSYTGAPISGDTIGQVPSPTDSLLSMGLMMYPETVIARKLQVEFSEATRQTAGESPLPPELFRNPDQLAFVDMYQDGDSFIRRSRLLADDDLPPELSGMGWGYSFALKAAMIAMDADTAWVDTERHICHVGDKQIPLNDRNFMIINFAMDEKMFQDSGGYISYEQVIDDSEWGIGTLIENNRFEDKVVLVGAAWPESGDVKATPFYKGTSLFSENEYPMYGVHVHKNIITTILEERFIEPTKGWQFLLFVLLMGALATVVNYRYRGFMGLFLSGVMIVVYSAIAVVLFVKYRRMIPMVAPGAAVVMFNYVSVVTYNFLTERRMKAMIRGAFSQYVPPSVVSELLKDPEMLTLGGEEREMTVIFSDVAGFTTISESLTPTQLVELLNEYLTAMTDIVLGYGGIIDKYEGDAIMAEYGAPLPDENHAMNACLTALDMQTELAKLRDKLKREGRPELTARVGINSGVMVVGNMGSNKIFDYTVMGDNVNLGSRLEGANKVYGTYIMCSEATRKIVAHAIITRELDLIQVKGKTEGILVHEVVAKLADGISDAKKQAIELYHQGLEAYKKKQWDVGIGLFNEALMHDPLDPPSKVYIERCMEFKDNPPPEDWDGIFTMRTK